MASSLAGVGCNPAAEIWKPKYSIDDSMKEHLSHFNRYVGILLDRSPQPLCTCVHVQLQHPTKPSEVETGM